MSGRSRAKVSREQRAQGGREQRAQGGREQRAQGGREQRAQGVVATFKIGGVDFVLVSKEDYLGTRGQPPAVSTRGPSSVASNQDAGRQSSVVTRRLFDARRQAGLSQAGLAKRLGKSQAFVSLSESGRAVVGDRYLHAVLQACGLSPSWGAVKPKRVRKTHDQLEASEIAGFDPETLHAVQKGSKRDKELAKKYVWWMNGRAFQG